MRLKHLCALVFALLLAFGVMAQPSVQDAKQDMKDAARDTKNATKKAGRKIKHGTKKVVNKSAHGVRKGAGKVEDKTSPPQ